MDWINGTILQEGWTTSSFKVFPCNICVALILHSVLWFHVDFIFLVTLVLTQQNFGNLGCVAIVDDLFIILVW